MAYIKDISLLRYSKNEAQICDRCGASIINVYVITFSNEVVLRYGIECFHKLLVSNEIVCADKMKINKILKNLTFYKDAEDKWKQFKPSDNISDLPFSNGFENSGMNIDEYTKWILEELIPYRVQEVKKELKRLKATFEYLN